jgi:choline monooxygenase
VAGLSSGSTQATLPWSWYCDAEVLRREQDRIFRRAWQYVCPTDLVADAGAYCAGRVGDVPVVVARDRDRMLRAFLNVCRHRGSVVAEGTGRRETLQCPYHAWTYGLDGRLRAAPRSQREPGFDRDGIALLPLSVETWGPLVFVNPDPAAAPLADALGPVADALVQAVDIAKLRFHRRTEFELACNWKIAVENYLECYHCPVAHPGFSEVVDVSPDAYRLEMHQHASSQLGPGRRGPAGAVSDGQFHWLWPVTKIYAMPGPLNLAAGPLTPLGAERTAGFLDYFFREDTADAEVEELLALDEQVGREDRVLVEAVQEGVRSGLLDEGRLLPESERLLAHFQRLVGEALA